MKAQHVEKLRLLPGTYENGTAMKIIEQGKANSFAAVIYGKDTMEANAAHIVHCANLHEELVQMVSPFAHTLSDDPDDYPDMQLFEITQHAVRKAEALLAKAKQEGA